MIKQDRKRNQHKFSVKPAILISFEGKTEKKYFSHFGGRDFKYNLVMAPGNETDPINIVKRAIKGIKENDLDLKNSDKAYCIIDTDISPDKNDVIEQAEALARKKGITLITSSPCIELWFYLHFEYTQSKFENKEILKKLQAKVKNYEKGNDIFDEIKPNIKKAIANAKRLEEYHNKAGNNFFSVEANPHSQVYKVIESFYD